MERMTSYRRNVLMTLIVTLSLLLACISLGDEKPDYHVPEVVERTARENIVFLSELSKSDHVGSGCLISSDGLVITCWHVVAWVLARGSTRIKIDWIPFVGATYGEVVYAAPEYDLALIKMDKPAGKDGAPLAESADKDDRIYPTGFTKREETCMWQGFSWLRRTKFTIDTGEITDKVSYSFMQTIEQSKERKRLTSKQLEDAASTLGKEHIASDLPDIQPPWAYKCNAWATGGQSGGACFGEDGRVIALNHGSAWENKEFFGSYMVPVELIRLFLVGIDGSGGIHRKIIDKYVKAGGQSVVGLPYESGGHPFAKRQGAGWIQTFRLDGKDRGIAVKDGRAEAFYISGAIWAHYASRGGPTYIGYPISDEYDVRGGRQQDFEKGKLFWSRTTNTVVLVPGGTVLGEAGSAWREHTEPGGVARTVRDTSKGAVDLVFCIDATGSMEDDIDEVKSRAKEIIQKLRNEVPNLRLGLVTYRDYAVDGANHLDPKDFVPLTDDWDLVNSRIQGIEVHGGGDTPEDVIDGLMKSLNMKWHDKVGKFVILIGDAPAKQPDHNGLSYSDVAKRSAEIDPVHVYGIVTAGNEAVVKDFGEVADATGGSVVTTDAASEVSDAIVDVVRKAVKQHRAEVGGSVGSSTDWQTPLLISTVVGIFILAVLCIAFAVRQRNQIEETDRGDDSVLCWLQVHEPGSPPQNHAVTASLVRIGRDESNDLVLDDPQVSAFHAEFRTDGQSAQITDLGSTNGTLVGGKRISEYGLQHGDVIRIGSVEIYYLHATAEH